MLVALEMALRFLLVTVLRVAVGYQRERVGEPAGLITHVFICVGSALFTVTSIHGFGFTRPESLSG